MYDCFRYKPIVQLDEAIKRTIASYPHLRAEKS